ncbi:hypothetical protein ACMFMF_006522 [Clarireedia jacksonii]
MCRMSFSYKKGRDAGDELPPYRPIYEDAVLLKYTPASPRTIIVTAGSNDTLKVCYLPGSITICSATDSLSGGNDHKHPLLGADTNHKSEKVDETAEHCDR